MEKGFPYAVVYQAMGVSCLPLSDGITIVYVIYLGMESGLKAYRSSEQQGGSHGIKLP